MTDTKKESYSWPLVGNLHVSEFLTKSMAEGDIGGSYIFLGPADLGKTTAAKYFIKTLLCRSGGTEPCGECVSCEQMGQKGGEDQLSAIHGDYHLIKKDKDKKNISIDQIREFNRIFSMSSFLNSYKTGIIKDAESLSQEAANALLKTLEEPRKKVVIILIASNLDNIPSTVVSRSRVLNFYPVSRREVYDHLLSTYNTPRSKAKELSRLCLGRPALAVKLWEEGNYLQQYRERAEFFLDALKESDINTRTEKLNYLLENKTSGREAAKKALGVIEVWRGVARDILLMTSGNNDLIQYELLKEKTAEVYKRFDVIKSIKLIGLLQKGEKQIKNNVNPGLVLENILFNI